MLKISKNTQVFVYVEPIDMRKSMNGLSVLVAETEHQTPLSGDLFVFFNKGRDIVKILYWHQNGFVIHHKKLEKLKFILPSKMNASSPIEITEVQLHGLLAGLDFMLMQKFPDIEYTDIF